MGGPTDAHADRAARFCERYAELYPDHRHGAHYQPRPVVDFQDALELCATWADDAHLERMVVAWLSEEDPSDEFLTRGTRSIRKFKSRASGYDEQLRRAAETDPDASADALDGDEWYVYSVRFAPGGELLFNRTNQHQNVLHVDALELETGTSRVVVEERQEAWQRNRPHMKFLDDGERFIWETEKTGFRQYELRHVDGRLLATLTRGEYPAANIVRIDEDAGVMYYMAYSAPNPLNAQLHRVSLDGSGQRTLTPESWSHSVRISPDGEWFITTYEAIDAPPASALYDTEGRFIALLAESDTAKLNELGLEPPELFTFRADDGERARSVSR